MSALPIFILFLLAVSVALFWLARKRQRASGLPFGRIIYTDIGEGSPVRQPLFDAELGLVGRPDYLIEKGDQLIPVEIKSSRAGATPYESHVYQMAAYCLLVEHNFGKRPSSGILRYANRTFAIDFTPELEITLINLIKSIRKETQHREINRSHEIASRCGSCGYRSHCDQKLA